MFTKEEAIAFLTAEKMIEHLTDEQNSRSFRRGMDKIRAALKNVDKDFLYKMDNTIEVHKNRSVKGTLPSVMQTILRSISNKRILEIGYANALEDETKRLIEAVGISYSGLRWYLSAWCYLREEYRMFRLDRIKSVAITTQQYTRKHPSLESLLECEDKGSIVKVILRTSKKMSRYYADRCYSMGLIEEKDLDGGRVEQTYMAYSLEYMARWILSNADVITVVEPNKIKDIMRLII